MKRILTGILGILLLASCGGQEPDTPSPAPWTPDLSRYGYVQVPIIGAGIYKGAQFTSLEGDAQASDLGRSSYVTSASPIPLGYSDTLAVSIPLLPGTYGKWELAVDLGDSPAFVCTSDESITVQRGESVTVSPLRLSHSEPILDFRFMLSANDNLQGDVLFTIDHQEGILTADIPYYAGLKAMKASFTLAEGAKAYVDGQEQISGVTSQNFYHPVKYSIVTADGFSKDYTVRVSHYTGLPVVFIDTPDAQEILSKEEWIEGTHIRIDGVGLFEDYESTTDNIKGRGNATWRKFPKKPYNIKLDKKSSMLGMPAHKRWSLLANYRDRSRICNMITFHIGSMMDGLAWTSRSQFVSLFLNGEPMGLYQFTEQVRIGEDRVDIDEFETDESGNYLNLDEQTITGGYLVHCDTYYDEEFHFRTAQLNLPIEFKDPNDNVPPEMMDYLRAYFNTVEGLLLEGSFEQAHELIDIDSFVDFWLAIAIVGSGDSARPGSDYLHKKRGGKLYAGPLWDFDGSFHNTAVKISTAMWYPYLLKDPLFVSTLKEHWERYKPWLREIPSYIDYLAGVIRKAEKYDADIWVPMIGFDIVHGDEFYTFPDAIARLKEFWAENFTRVEGKIDEYVSAIQTQ